MGTETPRDIMKGPKIRGSEQFQGVTKYIPGPIDKQDHLDLGTGSDLWKRVLIGHCGGFVVRSMTSLMLYFGAVTLVSKHRELWTTGSYLLGYVCL